MTPTRLSRRATDDSWRAVLANAEQQLAAAKDAFDLADPAGNAKPVAAAAVIAAIGFGDAICVQRGRATNAQQHDKLPNLLRDLLGTDAASEQLSRLGRILAQKNIAQYGAAAWTYVDARAYLEQVKRFASWARDTLASYDG